MALTLVQYRVKPDMVEENLRLIEAVFAELRARNPEGVKYASLHLGDGLFCHLVEDEAKKLQALEAFKTFQYDFEARREAAPQRNRATVIGNHHLLAFR
jgi:hypothetical protein